MSGLKPVVPALQTPASAEVKAKQKLMDEAKKAAQQFESMLLRQMLSSMQKTTALGGSTQTPGGSIYSSMVVETLSDAIAAQGGMGLADALLKAVPDLDAVTGQEKEKKSSDPLSKVFPPGAAPEVKNTAAVPSKKVD